MWQKCTFTLKFPKTVQLKKFTALKLSTFIISIIMLLSIQACKNKAQNNSNSIWLEFEKTACYGTCPIYKLTINNDRIMVLKGERFLDKIGEYQRTISKEDIKTIEKMIKETGFDKLDSIYDSGVSDLPSTIIAVHQKGKIKKVTLRHQYPEKLNPLIIYLDSFRKKDDWKKISAK